MIKLSKDELSRCTQIVMDVWNAVAYDIDIDVDFNNTSAMYICTDTCYIDMYGGNGRDDSRYMTELYDKYGYEQVVEALAEEYSLV